MVSPDFDGVLTEAEVRRQVATSRRLVVKVGSSSLSSASRGIADDRLTALVEALAKAHDKGHDIVLISSGAIAAGLAPLGLRRRPRDLAHQQAAAAVGQGLLMQRYSELFRERGVLAGQVLLTVDDVTRQSSYKNALRTLGTMLRMGVLPIINENDTVATHEIHFGDNDRLAALVAQLVRADALLLLSDVDSLFTAHPDEPGSLPISFVPDVEALTVDTHRVGSNIGSGGMTTKLQAAQIATGAGIPVILGRASRVEEILAGQEDGHCLLSDRQTASQKAALAGARVHRARRVVHGSGRGARGHRIEGLAAGCRHHQGDRRVRGRRSGRSGHSLG